MRRREKSLLNMGQHVQRPCGGQRGSVLVVEEAKTAGVSGGRWGRRGKQGQSLWVMLRILVPGKPVEGFEQREVMWSACLEHSTCVWRLA